METNLVCEGGTIRPLIRAIESEVRPFHGDGFGITDMVEGVADMVTDGAKLLRIEDGTGTVLGIAVVGFMGEYPAIKYLRLRGFVSAEQESEIREHIITEAGAYAPL